MYVLSYKIVVFSRNDLPQPLQTYAGDESQESTHDGDTKHITLKPTHNKHVQLSRRKHPDSDLDLDVVNQHFNASETTSEYRIRAVERHIIRSDNGSSVARPLHHSIPAHEDSSSTSEKTPIVHVLYLKVSSIQLSIYIPL